MKTNAIIRIVLFSLTLLILIGILLAGLGFGLFAFSGRTSVSNTMDTDLPLAMDGSANQTALSAEDVSAIEIEWVSGTITIVPEENADQITISETGSGNTPMVCSHTGSTLKIRYCESSLSFPSFGINISESKDLLITVPAGWVCEDLEVDAASANVKAQDMIIRNADFDGASGTCDFVNCQVGNLDVDGASGDISFTGTLDSLDFDGASASCRISVSNTPDMISMDGMSGDLVLTLPEDCGFTVSIDALSSDFTSDFPATMSGGNYVYGDGHCRISFDGMSGDLTIRKA